MTRNKFDAKSHQEKVKRDKITLRQEMIDHRGSDNRIAVLDLCEKLHFDRRYLRELVNSINTDPSPDYDGKLILTDTKKGGYWLDKSGDSPEYAADYCHSEHNRALDLLNKVKASEEKARRIHGKAAFALAMQEVKNEQPEQARMF